MDENMDERTIDIFADELFAYLLSRRLGAINLQPQISRFPGDVNPFTPDVGKSVLFTCYQHQEFFYEMFKKNYGKFKSDWRSFYTYCATSVFHMCRPNVGDVFDSLNMMGALILELAAFCDVKGLGHFTVKAYLCWSASFACMWKSEFFERGGWKVQRERAQKYAKCYEDKFEVRGTPEFVTLHIQWLTQGVYFVFPSPQREVELSVANYEPNEMRDPEESVYQNERFNPQITQNEPIPETKDPETELPRNRKCELELLAESTRNADVQKLNKPVEVKLTRLGTQSDLGHSVDSSHESYKIRDPEDSAYPHEILNTQITQNIPIPGTKDPKIEQLINVIYEFVTQAAKLNAEVHKLNKSVEDKSTSELEPSLGTPSDVEHSVISSYEPHELKDPEDNIYPDEIPNLQITQNIPNPKTKEPQIERLINVIYELETQAAKLNADVQKLNKSVEEKSSRQLGFGLGTLSAFQPSFVTSYKPREMQDPQESGFPTEILNPQTTRNMPNPETKGLETELPSNSKFELETEAANLNYDIQKLHELIKEKLPSQLDPGLGIPSEVEHSVVSSWKRIICGESHLLDKFLPGRDKTFQTKVGITEHNVLLDDVLHETNRKDGTKFESAEKYQSLEDILLKINGMMKGKWISAENIELSDDFLPEADRAFESKRDFEREFEKCEISITQRKIQEGKYELHSSSALSGEKVPGGVDLRTFHKVENHIELVGETCDNLLKADASESSEKCINSPYVSLALTDENSITNLFNYVSEFIIKLNLKLHLLRKKEASGCVLADSDSSLTKAEPVAIEGVNNYVKRLIENSEKQESDKYPDPLPEDEPTLMMIKSEVENFIKYSINGNAMSNYDDLGRLIIMRRIFSSEEHLLEVDEIEHQLGDHKQVILRSIMLVTESYLGSNQSCISTLESSQNPTQKQSSEKLNLNDCVEEKALRSSKNIQLQSEDYNFRMKDARDCALGLARSHENATRIIDYLDKKIANSDTLSRAKSDILSRLQGNIDPSLLIGQLNISLSEINITIGSSSGGEESERISPQCTNNKCKSESPIAALSPDTLRHSLLPPTEEVCGKSATENKSKNEKKYVNKKKKRRK